MLCREGLNNASRLFETETERNGAMGPAVADRAARRIDALEMGIAGGKFLSVMESIQTTDHGQAMIYGLRRGFRLLIELVTDVVEQGGLGDFRQRQR